MSDYEKRFNVFANGVSMYTDNVREALKWLDRDPHGWVTEGYADSEDVGPGHPDFNGIEGTLILRRTIGPVSREHLESLVASQEYEEFKAKVDATVQALYA